MNLASHHPDKRSKLSLRYQGALRAYLASDPQGDLEIARHLGRQAVVLELDTLDLARIHEIALLTVATIADGGPGIALGAVALSKSILGRAGVFFAEALTPIEQTHRGAREANLHLNQIVKALSHRTLELADSNEELRVEIILRKEIEDSLRASEQGAALLLEQSRTMQEELRLLSRQLLSIQEEERRRISRELHDVIAQTLTGITVQLATLKTNSNASTQELQQKIALTQRTVEQSVDIVHRFARELRPSVLDDLGLVPALQSYLKTYLEETGIRVSLTTFAKIEECDNGQRTALYRVAQEALTNITRHANATIISIKISRDETGITMTITDDGKGFTLQDNGCAKPTSRLGLLGMRERIEMIGGTFSIQSTVDNGTTVTVAIPTALLTHAPITHPT